MNTTYRNLAKVLIEGGWGADAVKQALDPERKRKPTRERTRARASRRIQRAYNSALTTNLAKRVGKGRPGLVNKFKITRRMMGGKD